MELSPRLSAGGYLSYVSDNRDHDAPQVMIRSPKGDVRPLLSLNPQLAKRNQAMWQRFVPSQTIAVRTADGLIGHHIVIEPATPAPPGGYPVIVNAHGGPASVVRPGGEYAFAFGQYAASRGYLFVDINYRGSASFGLNYRLPDGQGAMGASEVNDLIALVRYLKSRGDVNPKRVGVMGGSYGGHIVGLAMSRLPDDFAAGVSLFGVADWVVERKKDQEEEGDSRDPMHYLRLSERARIEDLAFASSPSAHIERWRGPTLFTIGDLDKNGHVESVTDLSYRLLERGVPVEIYVDPAGGHNVFPQQRVFEFFERYLNNVR
ncbi:MAG: S9 family peptidase [Steroidobacter sp.]|nr:S9 family peptidase [Steroidobacter sp.]